MISHLVQFSLVKSKLIRIIMVVILTVISIDRYCSGAGTYFSVLYWSILQPIATTCSLCREDDFVCIGNDFTALQDERITRKNLCLDYESERNLQTMTSCKTYLDPTLNAAHPSASSTLEVTTLPPPPASREAKSKAGTCLAALHTETLPHITVANTNNATTKSPTECRIDELAEPNNKRAIEIPRSGFCNIFLSIRKRIP
jgi:hypothetical protein